MATQYIYNLTSSWGAASSTTIKKAIQLNVQGAAAASYLSKLIEIQTSNVDNSNLQTQFGVYRDGHMIIGSETTNKFIDSKLNNVLHGTGNTTTGSYNLMSGFYNSCDGNLCVIQGANNKHYSNNAKGGTYAAGFTHIEGRYNTTSASYAHAEGFYNIIPQGGTGAHVEGGYNIAYSSGSHAEGYNTRTVAIYSHTEGNSTIASGSYQTVVGGFNKKGNTKAAFIVGGGWSEATRRDAFTVSSSMIEMSASLKMSTGIGFITASCNLPSTAGPSAGIYLPVRIGNVTYKIALLSN